MLSAQQTSKILMNLMSKHAEFLAVEFCTMAPSMKRSQRPSESSAWNLNKNVELIANYHKQFVYPQKIAHSGAELERGVDSNPITDMIVSRMILCLNTKRIRMRVECPGLRRQQK